MNNKVGPVAIVIGVIALVILGYFMYHHANPSPLGRYDPAKYGPPAYVKNMGKGNSYAAPGSTGGTAPGGAASPGAPPGPGNH